MFYLEITKAHGLNPFITVQRKHFSSTDKFKYQTAKIKVFMLRDGYSLHTRNSFIKRHRNDTKTRGNDDKNSKKIK